MRGSIKGIVEECVNVIEQGGWMQSEYYGDDNAARRGEITSVCSVGAARLAFRRYFNIPPEIADIDLIKHPAYAETMRYIGRAIYTRDSEQIDNPRPLLDGDEIDPETGNPYNTQQVEDRVVDWNDSNVENIYPMDAEEKVIEAFRNAADLAPEAEQDWTDVIVYST